MTPNAPKGRTAAEQDRDLDEALEDTFPASDPPAATNPSSFTGAEVAREKDGTEETRRESDRLDEELKQTFPASDTPTIVRKHEKPE
ncbi:hypothetical protein [Aquabacter spiritensis]|uniref:Uncharacterized protein n=1 Tax=Aquabacter spiritensis TaxID=933073 RepID=A0A4R3LY13_9HYPH|nr:hypothetical protein [Aquabacter spiritensis]TCT05532.1 hypothetical protein EDC64_10489 [Aquabacter spiritensis]